MCVENIPKMVEIIRLCINKNILLHPTYKSIFDTYPFELDHFQKYAIQGIEEGAHVLITAHTGSGKTLPAEYSIQKFCRNGKKVIYTAPIKSLANQKFKLSKALKQYSSESAQKINLVLVQKCE